MTLNNGSAAMEVNDAVDKLLESVDDVVKQIPEVLGHLEGQRAAIDAQIKQLRAMQRYFAPAENGAAPEKPTGEKRIRRVSPASLTRFAEGCLALGQEGREFTMLAVLEHIKGSVAPGLRPEAYAAFRALHARQFIAKTTKDPVTRQDLFLLDVVEGIDQIRAEADGVAH